ncbi:MULTISPECIES: hypothetical protein [unclassified Pseudomonas]|uniref:hypothetical protein n=1 Tax=unclassified Pseudomonas TaxID=196821 RepID=UPI000CD0FAC3|nr:MULTISPECIES: hypothetical protein [unclassified Pseudomonas]POA34049.1 hypothetical protein C1887_06310 [Pseudomonas sp. GW456-R21]
MGADDKTIHRRQSTHGYTRQQAAPRSLRIGQEHSARVIFFGYIDSSQITRLHPVTKKIGAGFGCFQEVLREQPNKNFSLDPKNGSLFRDPFLS